MKAHLYILILILFPIKIYGQINYHQIDIDNFKFIGIDSLKSYITSSKHDILVINNDTIGDSFNDSLVNLLNKVTIKQITISNIIDDSLNSIELTIRINSSSSIFLKENGSTIFKVPSFSSHVAYICNSTGQLIKVLGKVLITDNSIEYGLVDDYLSNGQMLVVLIRSGNRQLIGYYFR